MTHAALFDLIGFPLSREITRCGHCPDANRWFVERGIVQKAKTGGVTATMNRPRARDCTARRGLTPGRGRTTGPKLCGSYSQARCRPDLRVRVGRGPFHGRTSTQSARRRTPGVKLRPHPSGHGGLTRGVA